MVSFFGMTYTDTDRIDNLRISGKALLRPTEFYYFENYYQDKHNKIKTKLELDQRDHYLLLVLLPIPPFTFRIALKVTDSEKWPVANWFVV